MPCTTILVGKNATYDGSTMIARNDDAGGNDHFTPKIKLECDKLREKGISFLQSNSDCDAIRELYQDYEIYTVHAKRSINSNATKRGEINEVLIRYVPG